MERCAAMEYDGRCPDYADGPRHLCLRHQAFTVRYLRILPVRRVCAGLWPSAPRFDTVLADAYRRDRDDGVPAYLVPLIRGE